MNSGGRKLEELRLNSLFEYDRAFRSKYGVFAGIDEAGRGCLAGSVFAAAVVFGDGLFIEGLDDSKKLSAKTRGRLFDEITARAKAYSISFATVSEIDSLNILNAALLAMKRAFEGIGILCETALIDGNKPPDLSAKTYTLIGGDGKSAEIAAASVLAKVSRDGYMEELNITYPEYGFAKHKGYGTKAHYAAIEKHGVCPEHRRSFKLFRHE